MPIPEFDQRGMLPVGVYDCSLSEMAARFGWNTHRQRLVRSFGNFLAREIRSGEFLEPLYVNGSFVTDKDEPEDVDVVLDLRAASDDRKWRGLDLMQKERNRFREQYDVDFWVNLPGPNNFANFFQYVGVKSAKFKGLAHTDRKGILRIA